MRTTLPRRNRLVLRAIPALCMSGRIPYLYRRRHLPLALIGEPNRDELRALRNHQDSEAPAVGAPGERVSGRCLVMTTRRASGTFSVILYTGNLDCREF